MKALDFALATMSSGKAWLDNMLTSLEGNELTFPTVRGGNHPLWVVGHLAYAEGALFHAMVLGEANPLEKWAPLFGMGSQPVADAAQYPSFAEVLDEWNRLRASTIKRLSTMSDADLERPSHAPPEFRPMFGTIGQCVTTLCNHQMFHAGQVADTRRVAGLKPVFA